MTLHRSICLLLRLSTSVQQSYKVNVQLRYCIPLKNLLIAGGHSSHAKGKLLGSPARNQLIRRAILTAGFLDLQQQDAAISRVDLMEAAAANALLPFPLPACDRFLLAAAGLILASGCYCWSDPQAAQNNPQIRQTGLRVRMHAPAARQGWSAAAGIFSPLCCMNDTIHCSSAAV